MVSIIIVGLLVVTAVIIWACLKVGSDSDKVWSKMVKTMLKETSKEGFE